MILRPTTLVLGAGASAPYKYPTGATLLRELFEMSQDRDTVHLFRLLGISENEVKSFAESILKSAPGSIDAYLEHRPEHTRIGKILIAKSLISREIEDHLWEPNWYQYVFKFLNSDLDHFHQNKLFIITFNYDRSFEHFLFNALKHKYNIADAKTRELMDSFHIIHVHGKLSPLPWEDHMDNREYSSVYNAHVLDKAGDGIRIIHEKDNAQNELFMKAQHLLLSSEKIYFLGFGYHQVSLDRLGISRITNNIEINGTRYHLTDRQVSQIVRRNYNLSLLSSVHEQRDILNFLKIHVDFE